MLRAFCVWGVFWMRFAYGLPQSLSESFFDVRSEDQADPHRKFAYDCFRRFATLDPLNPLLQLRVSPVST